MDSDSSDEENCFRSKYCLYMAYLSPMFGYRYAFLRLNRIRS